VFGLEHKPGGTIQPRWYRGAMVLVELIRLVIVLSSIPRAE
jgi:hypothetical protein